MHSFCAAALVKDAQQRPDAVELSQHPFVAALHEGPDCVASLIPATLDWLAQQARREAAARTADGQHSALSARPPVRPLTRGAR